VIDILIFGLLAIFATYRIARLVSTDTILNGLRNTVNRKAAEQNSGWYYFAEWINCAHCVGIWIAFFIVIILSLYFRWGFLAGMLMWLAIAGGQSFLWSLVEGEDADS
jgi:hypothetical protein